MTRLIIVVEGASERGFVRELLAPHLRGGGVETEPFVIEGRTKAGYRRKLRRELLRRMDDLAETDAWFTTMYDLYALPADFPGIATGEACGTARERVIQLQRAFERDVDRDRFIAYIQLHEFEALLLSQPEAFAAHYAHQPLAVQALVGEVSAAGEPEEIDDGATTAPSKRIGRHFPRYAKQKPAASLAVAHAIGLPTIRARCPHFNAWLTKLESLAPTD